MCGIVGYTGEKQAAPFLIEGLKRLDYRGYDSFGIGVNNGQTIKLAHQVGPASEADWLRAENFPGTVGIAHTRWGTRGKVDFRNAHPISSSSCSVVHNGIIENYEKLLEELRKAGYQFTTGTDTEVIAHLVDSYIRIHDWAVIDSFSLEIPVILTRIAELVLKKIKGQNAFVIISKYFPSCLLAATSGPPLLITDDGYIASDKCALAGYSEKALRMQPGEIAIVSQKGVFTANKQRTQETVPDVNEVIMGDYPHFMLKEIAEQTTTVCRAMQDRSLLGFPCPDKVFLFGCGSSYNAALIGRYYVEHCLQIPAEADYASEIGHRSLNYHPINSVYIALTQSGETRDTIEACGHLRQPKIAVTNNPHSSIVPHVEHIYQLLAGPERGVAATKTFTSQVMGLLNVIASFGGIKDEVRKEIWLLPEKVSKGISQVWEERRKLELFAKTVSKYHNVLFLGTGMYHAVALEGALKLKEVSYSHAEAMPSAEMKHGPIALIDEHTLSIFVLGEANDRVIANTHEIIARGGKVMVITDSSTYSHVKGVADHVFVYPNVHMLVNPVVATVPLQLLAYYVAVHRNLNVDRPRNLAKSVTV